MELRKVNCHHQSTQNCTQRSTRKGKDWPQEAISKYTTLLQDIGENKEIMIDLGEKIGKEKCGSLFDQYYREEFQASVRKAAMKADSQIDTKNKERTSTMKFYITEEERKAVEGLMKISK